jgi:hypothetical protein
MPASLTTHAHIKSIAELLVYLLFRVYIRLPLAVVGRICRAVYTACCPARSSRPSPGFPGEMSQVDRSLAGEGGKGEKDLPRVSSVIAGEELYLPVTPRRDVEAPTAFPIGDSAGDQPAVSNTEHSEVVHPGDIQLHADTYPSPTRMHYTPRVFSNDTSYSNDSTNTTPAVHLGEQSKPFIYNRRPDPVAHSTPTRASGVTADQEGGPYHHTTLGARKMTFLPTPDIPVKVQEHDDVGDERPDMGGDGDVELVFDRPPPPVMSEWRKAQLRVPPPPLRITGSPPRRIPTLHGPASLPYARNPR